MSSHGTAEPELLARPVRAPASTPGSDLAGLLAQGLEHLNHARFNDAADTAAQAVALAPAHAFARLVHGVALKRLGRCEDALRALQQAAILDPNDARIRFNLAVTLAEIGNGDLAMVEYAACLALDPGFADALWNYGEMLRLREHFGKALECFDRLQDIEGIVRGKMAHRMAVCCAHLALDSRAGALFNQQLALDGEPVTHWEYALFLLGRGRFEEAWPHYARRFEAGERISVYRTAYPYDGWCGECEKGAALLVHGEQGAGDEILFASFLPLLLGQAAQAGMRIVLACRPSLARLFQASFADLIVVSQGARQPADVRAALAGCSRVWQVPVGDLPRWLSKPAPQTYLTPHPEDVAYMRERLGRREGLRIGLAWAANPRVRQANRRQRDVNPAVLNALVAGFQKSRPEVQFYNLLNAEHRPALAHLPDVAIRDMSAYLVDFSRTAALMTQMDVVVSVCTSTANLAGALGCDTRVLLQRHADWRWFQDTTWYRHITSYRQTIGSDWGDPLTRLFDALGGVSATSQS